MVGRAAESTCGHSRKISSSGRQKNIYTQVTTCLKKKTKSHFPQSSTDVYKALQIPLPGIKRCSTVGSATHFFSDHFTVRSESFGTVITSQPSSTAECEPINLLFTRWGRQIFLGDCFQISQRPLEQSPSQTQSLSCLSPRQFTPCIFCYLLCPLSIHSLCRKWEIFN